MNCPACGYTLSHFDKSCPRCANLAKSNAAFERTQQLTQAPPGASANYSFTACPQCGLAIPAGMPVCPRCSIQYITPMASAPPAFHCSACGARLDPGSRFCKLCGVLVAGSGAAPAIQLPGHAVGGQYSADPADFSRPKVALIAVMWCLLGAAWLLGLVPDEAGMHLATVFDIAAIVLAIILCCSRSRVDRVNGYAAGSIMAVSAIVFAIIASGR